MIIDSLSSGILGRVTHLPPHTALESLPITDHIIDSETDRGVVRTDKERSPLSIYYCRTHGSNLNELISFLQSLLPLMIYELHLGHGIFGRLTQKQQSQGS